LAESFAAARKHVLYMGFWNSLDITTLMPGAIVQRNSRQFLGGNNGLSSVFSYKALSSRSAAN
jgi:hypothetical protein